MFWFLKFLFVVYVPSLIVYGAEDLKSQEESYNRKDLTNWFFDHDTLKLLKEMSNVLANNSVENDFAFVIKNRTLHVQAAGVEQNKAEPIEELPQPRFAFALSRTSKETKFYLPSTDSISSPSVAVTVQLYLPDTHTNVASKAARPDLITLEAPHFTDSDRLPTTIGAHTEASELYNDKELENRSLYALPKHIFLDTANSVPSTSAEPFTSSKQILLELNSPDNKTSSYQTTEHTVQEGLPYSLNSHDIPYATNLIGDGDKFFSISLPIFDIAEKYSTIVDTNLQSLSVLEHSTASSLRVPIFGSEDSYSTTDLQFLVNNISKSLGIESLVIPTAPGNLEKISNGETEERSTTEETEVFSIIKEIDQTTKSTPNLKDITGSTESTILYDSNVFQVHNVKSATYFSDITYTKSINTDSFTMEMANTDSFTTDNDLSDMSVTIKNDQNSKPRNNFIPETTDMFADFYTEKSLYNKTVFKFKSDNAPMKFNSNPLAVRSNLYYKNTRDFQNNATSNSISSFHNISFDSNRNYTVNDLSLLMDTLSSDENFLSLFHELLNNTRMLNLSSFDNVMYTVIPKYESLVSKNSTKFLLPRGNATESIIVNKALLLANETNSLPALSEDHIGIASENGTLSHLERLLNSTLKKDKMAHSRLHYGFNYSNSFNERTATNGSRQGYLHSVLNSNDFIYGRRRRNITRKVSDKHLIDFQNMYNEVDQATPVVSAKDSLKETVRSNGKKNEPKNSNFLEALNDPRYVILPGNVSAEVDTLLQSENNDKGGSIGVIKVDIYNGYTNSTNGTSTYSASLHYSPFSSTTENYTLKSTTYLTDRADLYTTNPTTFQSDSSETSESSQSTSTTYTEDYETETTSVQGHAALVACIVIVGIGILMFIVGVYLVMRTRQESKSVKDEESATATTENL